MKRSTARNMALGCRLVVAVLLVLTAACTTEARKTKAELTKEDRVRTLLKMTHTWQS